MKIVSFWFKFNQNSLRRTQLRYKHAYDYGSSRKCNFRVLPEAHLLAEIDLIRSWISMGD